MVKADRRLTVIAHGRAGALVRPRAQETSVSVLDRMDGPVDAGQILDAERHGKS